MNINRRKDGIYYKEIMIKGKRYYFTSSDEKEVEKKIIEFKHNKNKGLIIDDKNYTVSQWAQIWVDTYKSNLEEATITMYKSVIKCWINKYIGNIKLKDLKQKDIVFLLNAMSDKGLTRRKDVAFLTINQMLDKAVENDYIAKNVSKGISIKKTKSKEKQPLSDNLINDIKKLARNDSRAYMILFMIYTGVRKEELIPLQYKDIDFSSQFININKAVSLVNNQPKLKTTKNEENRKIPILPPIADKLKELKKTHNDQDYVFPNTKGNMMSDTTMKRQIKYVINDLNKLSNTTEIYFTYHQLRHTYACILHKAKVPIKEAQYFMGHKTMRVLLEIYTHLDEEDKKIASNLLRDFTS